MMSIEQSPYSSMIYNYLKRYQENPSSRVFAPLAEAYRKAGLVDEAIEIAKEGLEIHPRFIGGKVALARALFDKKQFAEVIDQLTPVIQENPDNLVAQRLLAESCLMVGRVAEALSAYKMLLYFSPTDQETARLVWELEAEAYEQGTLVLQRPEGSVGSPAPIEPDFEIRSAQEAIQASPERIQAFSEDRRRTWVKKVEFLQSLLLQIERYRSGRQTPG